VPPKQFTACEGLDGLKVTIFAAFVLNSESRDFG
jgi:hypothetical protein